MLCKRERERICLPSVFIRGTEIQRQWEKMIDSVPWLALFTWTWKAVSNQVHPFIWKALEKHFNRVWDCFLFFFKTKWWLFSVYRFLFSFSFVPQKRKDWNQDMYEILNVYYIFQSFFKHDCKGILVYINYNINAIFFQICSSKSKLLRMKLSTCVNWISGWVVNNIFGYDWKDASRNAIII